MKVLIASDSYKGSLSALDVGNAIKRGISKSNININTVVVPMADGGEGTVQSLIYGTSGSLIVASVQDPLGRIVESFYGVLGNKKTAIIEIAAASGLTLLKTEEYDAKVASSFGVGQLIKDALNRGCEEIILGLGGSATNDAGTGMLKALGVNFLDSKKNNIGLGGLELSKIESIDVSDLDPRIKKVKFIVASDVDNPLCGDNGASKVYGGQKGASINEIEKLDDALLHFSEIVKRDFFIDKKDVSGAGAAGGIGYAAITFLNGELKSGTEIVMEMTNLEQKIKDADLVITGEGRIDYQTAFGKAPLGVAKLAKSKGKPVIAIAGSLGENYNVLYSKGFDGIFSIINRPMSLNEAIDNAEQLLENLSESIIRTLSSYKTHILNK